MNDCAALGVEHADIDLDDFGIGAVALPVDEVSPHFAARVSLAVESVDGEGQEDSFFLAFFRVDQRADCLNAAIQQDGVDAVGTGCFLQSVRETQPGHGFAFTAPKLFDPTKRRAEFQAEDSELAVHALSRDFDRASRL